MLEKEDQEKVATEKKAAEARILVASAFQREYAALMVRTKGTGESSSEPPPPPPSRLPHHIPQAEARLFIPAPGHCHIWQGRTRGEWNGHYPPNKRVHKPFVRYGGSEGALKECLKDLWMQHLTKLNLGVEHCPFRQDLFGD